MTQETPIAQEVTQNSTDVADEVIEQVDLNQLDELKAQIESLTVELKAAKEGQARANADSYNAQKRMESETEKAKKFALQKFAKDLLDVVDNLERGLEAGEKAAADESVLEGIRLTHKVLLGVLEKNGITVVNPVGEKFNPDYHEAVGIAPDVAADTVGVVLQKGYTLHERSIRPAMVLVGQ